MKYYAVKVGLVPGIYNNWSDCEPNVKGFSGAQYKLFKSEELAKAYLSGKQQNANKTAKKMPKAYAFCDGSFNSETKEYGFGGFLVANGKETILQGKGNDDAAREMQNVAGELLGAMTAVKTAMKMGLKSLTIYYDYNGIEMWAKGEWKTKKPSTLEYKMFMEDAMKSIKLKFVHVKGHSGVEGNERADKLAKEAVGI